MSEVTSTASDSTEQWRPVVGYEELYEVSDRGQVYGRSRYCPSRKGRRGSGLQFRLGGVLRSSQSAGYPMVVLVDATGRKRNRTIHILVAAAFIGPRPRGLVINHKDGNKTNNVPGNLEYVTCGENMAHAYRTGLKNADSKQGERHHNAKLKVADVQQARAWLAAGVSQAEIGRRLHVNGHTIKDIARGATWRSVPT